MQICLAIRFPYVCSQIRRSADWTCLEEFTEFKVSIAETEPLGSSVCDWSSVKNFFVRLSHHSYLDPAACKGVKLHLPRLLLVVKGSNVHSLGGFGLNMHLFQMIKLAPLPSTWTHWLTSAGVWRKTHDVYALSSGVRQWSCQFWNCFEAVPLFVYGYDMLLFVFPLDLKWWMLFHVELTYHFENWSVAARCRKNDSNLFLKIWIRGPYRNTFFLMACHHQRGLVQHRGECDAEKTSALKWFALKWGPMNIVRLQWYLQRGVWCWLPKGTFIVATWNKKIKLIPRRKGKYGVFRVPVFRDKLSVLGSVVCCSVLLMYSCFHHQKPTNPLDSSEQGTEGDTADRWAGNKKWSMNFMR